MGVSPERSPDERSEIPDFFGARNPGLRDSASELRRCR
jgi:hypothetical protein